MTMLSGPGQLKLKKKMKETKNKLRRKHKVLIGLLNRNALNYSDVEVCGRWDIDVVENEKRRVEYVNLILRTDDASNAKAILSVIPHSKDQVNPFHIIDDPDGGSLTMIEARVDQIDVKILKNAVAKFNEPLIGLVNYLKQEGWQSRTIGFRGTLEFSVSLGTGEAKLTKEEGLQKLNIFLQSIVNKGSKDKQIHLEILSGDIDSPAVNIELDANSVQLLNKGFRAMLTNKAEKRAITTANVTDKEVFSFNTTAELGIFSSTSRATSGIKNIKPDDKEVIVRFLNSMLDEKSSARWTRDEKDAISYPLTAGEKTALINNLAKSISKAGDYESIKIAKLINESAQTDSDLLILRNPILLSLLLGPAKAHENEDKKRHTI